MRRYIPPSIVIIAIFPLKLNRFGNHIFADFVVDVGFVGLAELVAAAHTVHVAVLDEIGARLVLGHYSLVALMALFHVASES